MEEIAYQKILEARKAQRQARLRKRRKQRLTLLLLVFMIFILSGVLLGLHRHRLENLPSKYPMDANVPMVNIAKNELGNQGGEKFWSWYGFKERVEWCACFVSWVENENGYIDEGKAPLFCAVQDGADWFQARDQWLDGKKTPQPGDVIFFDWDGNGGANHVGIVSNVVDDVVIAIEGNSADTCRHKRYKVGNKCILGYGHIEQQ